MRLRWPKLPSMMVVMYRAAVSLARRHALSIGTDRCMTLSMLVKDKVSLPCHWHPLYDGPCPAGQSQGDPGCGGEALGDAGTRGGLSTRAVVAGGPVVSGQALPALREYRRSASVWILPLSIHPSLSVWFLTSLLSDSRLNRAKIPPPPIESSLRPPSRLPFLSSLSACPHVSRPLPAPCPAPSSLLHRLLMAASPEITRFRGRGGGEEGRSPGVPCGHYFQAGRAALAGHPGQSGRPGPGVQAGRPGRAVRRDRRGLCARASRVGPGAQVAR
jgi:hypothetical protein